MKYTYPLTLQPLFMGPDFNRNVERVSLLRDRRRGKRVAPAEPVERIVKSPCIF